MEVHIDGFEELLRRVVREELAANREGWLTSREAAAYLGVSVGQLHNLVSAGRCPEVRHPGKARRLCLLPGRRRRVSDPSEPLHRRRDRLLSPPRYLTLDDLIGPCTPT